MRRRPKRNITANKKAVEASDNLIRQNSATVYGLYFASSNTDFLLDEKKTRFSLRPSVVVKPDRQTIMFDYSQVSGDESSIFDGFFRGLSAGATLTLDGGIESTCNFINEVTGVPLTNFADTYTISTVDVSKKILVATKGTTISSTTASVFDGRYFIDLPQWTKTQTNEDSTSISKILNLLPSQSIRHLGVAPGSILEFTKTSKNNSNFTVESIYIQNGIECIDVTEQVVQEDASDDQVIISVYGEESPIERSSADPPVLPAPTMTTPGNALNECCPCIRCLYNSIRRAESNVSGREGCDAPCTGPSGDRQRDCGPYQIDTKSYIKDICGPPNAPGQPCRGGVTGGALMPGCCEACERGFADKIKRTCPDDDAACCTEKKRASELLMTCFYRRYNRNPSGGCDCTGPIDHNYSDGELKCCTCEDMARRHNRGPGKACDDLGQNYWEKEFGVRYWMQDECPDCDWEFFGPSPDPTFPGFYPSGR